ncbi:hypothetical protein A2U01_0001649 [Trifolium medium]|uniref:Uncharacterized protein n=1 Tax=Trifolium medium TaxID=97028 RepID=A0A392M1J1_9FABA|nr:hypothetical protein [Trifolium medium]
MDEEFVRGNIAESEEQLILADVGAASTVDIKKRWRKLVTNLRCFGSQNFGRMEDTQEKRSKEFPTWFWRQEGNEEA